MTKIFIAGLTIFILVRSIPHRVRELLVKLNIFDTYSPEVHVIYRQRITTRCYLVCLLASLIILGVYNLFDVQTTNITISTPSQSTYVQLYESHSDSLQCDCSQVSMAYSDFIELTPIMHQLCSSQFVSTEWLDHLLNINVSLTANVVSISASYFQLLASFCSLSNSTIIDSLRVFAATQFVNSQVLPPLQFAQQTQALNDTFTATTLSTFTNMFNLVRFATTANQFATGPNSNGWFSVDSNGNTEITARRLTFLAPYTTSAPCSCTRISSSCSAPVWHYYNDFTFFQAFSNQFGGCLIMDNALVSTLACWYNQSCLTSIRASLVLAGVPDTFNITTLNAGLSSRFPLQTPLSELMNEMLIEQWVVNISYENFYRGCAPKTCIYTQEQRSNIFLILLTIVAIYGGLSRGLQLLVPWIVRLALSCLRWRRDRINHPQNDAGMIRPLRLHTNLLQKISSLNLFVNRSSSANTVTRERLSTRFYIALLLISLAAIITNTSLMERSHSEQVINPSIEDYEQLQVLHPNTLQCSCSKIAIPFKSFVTDLTATLHPVCASQFLSNNLWIYYLDNMYNYNTWILAVDFRRWGSNFFVWIGAFCSLASSTISNAVTNFQATSIITVQPMTRSQFQYQTDLAIASFETDMRKNFAQTLELYRDAMQGNAIMSLLVSNWLPVEKQRSNVGDTALLSTPVMYNVSCSCATSRTCVEPAGIYTAKGRLIRKIKGVVRGCFLLESYLASSFSCFYSNSCLSSLIGLIPIMSPYSEVTNDWPFSMYPPVSPMNSSLLKHFSVDDNFATIVGELFVDDWSINTSYESYFNACSPRYCTYSMVHRFDWLYVMSTFLSLYGGLTLVLRFGIPCAVRIAFVFKVRMQVGPHSS